MRVIDYGYKTINVHTALSSVVFRLTTMSVSKVPVRTATVNEAVPADSSTLYVVS